MPRLLERASELLKEASCGTLALEPAGRAAIHDIAPSRSASGSGSS